MEPTPARGAAETGGEAIDVSAVQPVRTRAVAVALVLFVALLAGTFLLGLAPQKLRKGRLAETAALLDATPVVNVSRPTSAPPQDELRLPADVRAYAEATLEARATGYLKALHADLGDRVKQGELLAEIDAPDLDAELVRAQATAALAQQAVAKASNDLDLAKTTLARYEGFAQKGGVTPQDLDEKRSSATQSEVALATAKAGVAASEAEVARLATLQKFERITAPFVGIVTARDLDVGTLLPSGANGRVLFRVARTDVVRVFVDVPQGDATEVVVGGDATLTVRNHPGREFGGKIARTTGALDPATRTLRIQVDVQNGEALLLPGMYGEARLKLARRHGRVTVPTGALVFDGQGTHVWLVRDGKATRVDVVPGIDFGTTIELENGLAADADVVTNPSERLVEGGAVRVAGRTVSGAARRPATPVALALASALTLAGCRSDADQDPKEYRKILDATVAPAADPPADEPLTLARAMAVANQREERLGLSGEEYVQSLLLKHRAVANFLPTIGFQPTFAIGDRPSGATGGKPSSLAGVYKVHGDTLQQFEAPVVGQMNLFNGMGDVANLKAVEAEIVARRELLLDLQATVLLNVAQAFYAVLRSERSVAVLTQSLAAEEARLADIVARESQGLATKLAVAQTRAQVDATRADLVTAKSDVVNGRHALALVVGVPAIPQPLEDTLKVPDDVGPEAAFEERALDQRADLKAARAAIETADHQVDAAVSQYYPSITLDVTGFLYRESFADASKWNALLSANLPIFSAGRIEADVRIAWSRLRQAALDESATRRRARFDVQVAFENLAASRRRIQEREDQVAAAAEARDRALDARASGLGIELDVLLAQVVLQNAELALADARFDRSVFFLDLQRATGQLPNAD